MGDVNESTLTAFEVAAMVRQHDGVTPSAVSVKTDLSVSTAHRHLASLEAVDVVFSEGGQYYPSLGGLQFQNNVSRYEQLKPVIARIQRTSASLKFDLSLIVEEAGSGICVFTSTSSSSYQVGSRVDLGHDFAGQMYVAALPDRERETYIDVYDVSVPEDETIEGVPDGKVRRERVQTLLRRAATPIVVEGEPKAVVCAEDDDGLLNEVPGQLRNIAEELGRCFA
jgi:DNA-binding IclR family transcriptional regulator